MIQHVVFNCERHYYKNDLQGNTCVVRYSTKTNGHENNFEIKEQEKVFTCHSVVLKQDTLYMYLYIGLASL